MLLGEVEMANEKGLSVRFWKIPREWNLDADAAAKDAALEGEASPEWLDVLGLPL